MLFLSPSSTESNWESDLVGSIARYLQAAPNCREKIAALRSKHAAFKPFWQAKFHSLVGFFNAHTEAFSLVGDLVQLASSNDQAKLDQPTTVELPHLANSTLSSTQPLGPNATAVQAKLDSLRDRLKDRTPHYEPDDKKRAQDEPRPRELPRKVKSGPVDMQEVREILLVEQHSRQRPHTIAHKLRRSPSTDKDEHNNLRTLDDWERELVSTLMDYLTHVAPHGTEDIHVLTAKFGHKHRVAIYHKYRKFRVFLQNHRDIFEVDGRDQVGLASGSPRLAAPPKHGAMLGSSLTGRTGSSSVSPSPSISTSTASWEVQLITLLLRYLQHGSADWNTLANAFPQFRSHIKYSYGTFKVFLQQHLSIFRLSGEIVSALPGAHAPGAPSHPQTQTTSLSGPTINDGSSAFAYDAPTGSSHSRRISPRTSSSSIPMPSSKPSPPSNLTISPKVTSHLSVPTIKSSSQNGTAPIAIPGVGKRRKRVAGDIGGASSGSGAESIWSDSDVEQHSRASGSDIDHDEDFGRHAEDLDETLRHSDDDRVAFDDTDLASAEVEVEDVLDTGDSSSPLSSTPTSSTTFGLNGPLDVDTSASHEAPPAAPAYRPKFRPALRTPGSTSHSSSKKTAHFALPTKPVMPSFTFFPRPDMKLKVKYIDNITTGIFAINDLLQFNRLAVGCQGVKGSKVGRLSLVVITARDTALPRRAIYLFDVARCVELSKYLRNILEDERILKVFHNGRQDISAIYHQQSIKVVGVVDTKVLFRMLLELQTLGGNTETTKLSLVTLISRYQQPANPHREQVRVAVNSELSDGPAFWHSSLTKQMIEYAAYEVAFLLDIHSLLCADLVSALGQSVLALSKQHAYADLLAHDTSTNIVDTLSAPIPTQLSWFRDFFSGGLAPLPPTAEPRK